MGWGKDMQTKSKDEPLIYVWFLFVLCYMQYHQISNICYTLVGTEIGDHSDVAGASPVRAAPTTSSFST